MLVVDRDAKYREWLRLHLGILCPDATVSAMDVREFEPWSARVSGRECDVLLLATSFGTSPEDPEAHGLDLLRKLRAQNVTAAVIALADEGNELTAVRALQLGAVDYLPKRLLTPERLKTSIRVALRRIEQRVVRRLADLAQTAQVVALDAAAQQPAPKSTAESASQAASESVSESAPKSASESAPESAPEPAQARESEAAESADAGAMPQILDADTPPVIPGYSIAKRIGESEKAVVYLAASAALGKDVALKVSRNSRDGNAERQMLEREYKAILAIRDPAVVTIHDYGIENGLEYLAMDYFPRGDLKARMYFGVTEAETLRYVEQIAGALRVVHGAGLVHRDLKPPNVMLRDNDDVALIDFGLARTLDGGAQSTRTGVLRGSPYYMSPEQALGEALDARSDLYSLGVIYHEMLTGRKPFTGGSAIEVLQQHVNNPPPRLPLSLSRHVPLVSRLLAKRREDRFNTADEVIAALAALRPSTVPQAQSTAA
jgi:DNA-binding response OmpR family regulator/tRNA A-37 threonylcarbamoyl transferase component Bud32